MNKLIAMAGAMLFPTTSLLAASYQPTVLKNVFYQAAWEEYAEGIAQDLQDPALLQDLEAAGFRAHMYRAINFGNRSFNHDYFSYEIDDSECVNMQITQYTGVFSIQNPAENIYSVSLQEMNVSVETLQQDACAPKL